MDEFIDDLLREERVNDVILPRIQKRHILEEANEIQEVMGRTYGMPEIDEDDLEAELDALGDDFALDDDTSYLDDALKAPDAPEKEPGADSVAVNQDGVMVDEFGLPKIPTAQ